MQVFFGEISKFPRSNESSTICEQKQIEKWLIFEGEVKFIHPYRITGKWLPRLRDIRVSVKHRMNKHSNMKNTQK